MLASPSNATFLLGIGSPHLAGDRNSAISAASKSFLQSASTILANPACTDHALWINQIILKSCRQRAARDESFLKEFRACIQQNAAAAIPSVESRRAIDKLLDQLMAMTMSTRARDVDDHVSDGGNFSEATRINPDEAEQAEIDENGGAMSGLGDPWVTVVKILESVQWAANESPEAIRLRECEARRKAFKQANTSDLDKIFGKNPNNSNSNDSNNNNNNKSEMKKQQAQQSASSSTNASPKSTASNKSSLSATPTLANSTKNFPPPPSPSASLVQSAITSSTAITTASSSFTVDIHRKIQETNLQVIRATMTSLREEADDLRELEQSSATRKLHKELEKILEDAKTRVGLHVVERWQTQRDKERGKTGNDYGSLVEDYAWRHSIPFLLMSVCNDDDLCDPSVESAASSSPATATRNSSHQNALGDRWNSWNLQERLAWFERCQRMDLSDDELAKADRCWCPKCTTIARGNSRFLNHDEVAKDAAVADSDLLRLLPTVAVVGAADVAPRRNQQDDDDEHGQQHDLRQQHHVDSIRRPDRDETKEREKFKLFRRYCWRMKLPFLRLIQNVGYSCPKTKDDKLAAVRGELDGMLVNVCHSQEDGLCVLAIIEVKMNPADLVYARAQRERFVETMRQRGDSMTFSLKSVEDWGRHMSLFEDRFRLFLSDPQRRWIFCTVRNKPDRLSLPFYSKISHWFVRAMASVATKSPKTKELPHFAAVAASVPLSPPSASSDDNDESNLELQQKQDQKKESGQRRQRPFNNNNNKNNNNSCNHNKSSASSSSSSSSDEEKQFVELRTWIDSIRQQFSNWTPTDDECQRVSFALLQAWQKAAQESGVHPVTKFPLLQAPRALLSEDDDIKRRNFSIISRQQQQHERERQGKFDQEILNQQDAPGNICWIDLPQGATPEQLKRK